MLRAVPINGLAGTFSTTKALILQIIINWLNVLSFINPKKKFFWYWLQRVKTEKSIQFDFCTSGWFNYHKLVETFHIVNEYKKTAIYFDRLNV